MIASAIAGGIKGAADVGIGIFNAVQQQKQFQYQKKLQQQIFQREDTAVQRRVAELQAAGLSPVLAAGAGAGAGQVVSTKAPQYEGSGDPVSGVMDAMMASKTLKAKDSEIAFLKSQKAHMDAETKTEDELRPIKVEQATQQAGLLQTQASVALLDSMTRAEQWKRDHPYGAPLPFDKNTPAGKILNPILQALGYLEGTPVGEYVAPIFSGMGYTNNVYDKDGRIVGTFSPSSDPVLQQEQADLLREKNWARINARQNALHSQRPLTEQAKQQLYEALVKAKERSGNSAYFRGGEGKSSEKWKKDLPVYKMTAR